MRRYRLIFVLYASLLAFGAAFGVMMFVNLNETTTSLEDVVRDHALNVIEVERLRVASERIGRVAGVYAASREPSALEQLREADREFNERLHTLSLRLTDPESLRMLAEVRALHLGLERPLLDSLDPDVDAPAIAPGEIRDRAERLRRGLDESLVGLGRREGEAFREAQEEAVDGSDHRARRLALVGAFGALLAIGVTVALARVLLLLRKSRAELERSNARLAQINGDLDSFAGRVAHDLRNVVSPLALTAQVLRKKSGDPEAVRDTADRLQRLSRRADRLIGSLLAFARATQPPEGASTASVLEAVSDAVEDLSPQATAAGAHVAVEIEDAQVAVPPPLLHTVLVNLLGNAIKFIAGSPRREVSVRSRRRGGDFEIEIEDTGPGIPKEAQRKLFTPFYRVPGASAPGSGIGLATVDRILKSHGGQVELKSEPGRGATFTVRLPVGEAPAVH